MEDRNDHSLKQSQASPAAKSATIDMDELRAIAPKRRWGQNFLISRAALDRIVATLTGPASSRLHNHLVWEIGSGTGIITASLLPYCGKIAGFEIDPDLCAILRRKFSRNPNFLLMPCDVLMHIKTLSPTARDTFPRLAVGNAPYNSARAILRALATTLPPTTDMAFVLQREVAIRIASGPNSALYSETSALLQARYSITRVFDLPPNLFWPSPRARSSFVTLTPISKRNRLDMPLLSRLLQILFRSRRQTMENNLKHIKNAPRDSAGASTITPGDILRAMAASDINPAARAETISSDRFAALTDALADRAIAVAPKRQ